MADQDVVNEQPGIIRTAAAIMSCVICPEKSDWSALAVLDFLRMRFADEDLDRFRSLLAGHYENTLTEDEADTLERYMLMNCFVAMLHERARPSPERANAASAGDESS